MAIPPAAHEAFAMQSQKAGIAEEFDPGVLQRIVERLVERFARGELLMIDGQPRNEIRLGAQQALRAWHVGNHCNDLGGIVWVPGGVDQGLEVRAPARDQDADALPRHLALPASVPW